MKYFFWCNCTRAYAPVQFDGLDLRSGHSPTPKREISAEKLNFLLEARSKLEISAREPCTGAI